MPPADDQFILGLGIAKDNPSAAVFVLAQRIDGVERDDRGAMNANEQVAELAFERLQGIFDQVPAAGMDDNG